MPIPRELPPQFFVTCRYDTTPDGDYQLRKSPIITIVLIVLLARAMPVVPIIAITRPAMVVMVQ